MTCQPQMESFESLLPEAVEEQEELTARPRSCGSVLRQLRPVLQQQELL